MSFENGREEDRGERTSGPVGKTVLETVLGHLLGVGGNENEVSLESEKRNEEERSACPFELIEQEVAVERTWSLA